jgi:hypothetical protein
MTSHAYPSPIEEGRARYWNSDNRTPARQIDDKNRGGRPTDNPSRETATHRCMGFCRPLWSDGTGRRDDGRCPPPHGTPNGDVVVGWTHRSPRQSWYSAERNARLSQSHDCWLWCFAQRTESARTHRTSRCSTVDRATRRDAFNATHFRTHRHRPHRSIR